MAQKMGLAMGLDPQSNGCFKRKFRWLFFIDNICSDEGVNSLPPLKSARPSISFKEQEAQHLNETIHFPMKIDYKTVPLTLYDLKKREHPVFKWLKEIYDPEKDGKWKAPKTNGFKKSKARLKLFDGCGTIIEEWVYENIYPSEINFGDLEMSNGDFVTVDLVLRFDRAYLKEDPNPATPSPPPIPPVSQFEPSTGPGTMPIIR